MRLLYVADGRSPIALNWIEYFVEKGHEVHLVSSFPSKPDMELASYDEVSLAFSQLKSSQVGTSSPSRGGIWGASTLGLRTRIRQWLGPLTLSRPSRRLRERILEIQPDLVHAMRIPYEGMLAAMAMASLKQKEGDHKGSKDIPLLISVWGNDFTLHAPSSPLMRRYTRMAVSLADALHTDCERDQRLGISWGFDQRSACIVLPGGGGVRREIFYPPRMEGIDGGLHNNNDRGYEQHPVVINPRGFRAYTCNRAFFSAIPLVLEKYPQARFICPGMAGEASAERWVAKLGITHAVELLPVQPHFRMAELYRRAKITVSPTTHDGTPNSLLEAMACGCFPVVGDIESLREWIDSGENGLLVDPTDPHALAEAILAGYEDVEMRENAVETNLRLVDERAEYRKVMEKAENFYLGLVT